MGHIPNALRNVGILSAGTYLHLLEAPYSQLCSNHRYPPDAQLLSVFLSPDVKLSDSDWRDLCGCLVWRGWGNLMNHRMSLTGCNTVRLLVPMRSSGRVVLIGGGVIHEKQTMPSFSRLFITRLRAPWCGASKDPKWMNEIIGIAYPSYDRWTAWVHASWT